MAVPRKWPTQSSLLIVLRVQRSLCNRLGLPSHDFHSLPILQVVKGTSAHAIALGGENALPRFDDTAYGRIESYKSGRALRAKSVIGF